MSAGALPEIERPIDLCTPDGRLHRASVGWSRRPLHRCNLRGHWGRKKRWDYWCVTTDTHLLAVTYANLDYLGLANAYFLDYASKLAVDKTVVAPLAMGFWQPETVGGGDLRARGLGLHLEILEAPLETRIIVEARGLSADIAVERPRDHETLGVVVPWSDERFQYTSKHNTLPARGEVKAFGREHPFGPDNQAFACLDFGRGIWPFATTWNWASASGRAGGHRLGLQLGGQWTDGTGSNENALCVDGRLFKIHDDIVFGYDRARFSAPWTLKTTSSRGVELVFRPFFERASRVELGLARSEVHQMFGHFEGTVSPEEGVSIPVRGLMGWAEEHRARW